MSGKPDSNAEAIAAAFRVAFQDHVQGRLEEADAGYRDLLRRAPDHVDGLHFLGVLLHQSGQHLAALELIGRAIERAPEQAAAHVNLGVVLLALERQEEAVDSFDRALAGNADLVDVIVRRARVLIALGRHDEALSGFDRALTLDPAASGLRADRGGLLVEMKRYDAAIIALREVLELEPDNVAALSNLGGALVELKRQGEALVCLDRALALDPGAVNALFNRGTALRDLRRPEEAVCSYRQLLAIEPDYPYAAGFLFNSMRQCCDWSDYSSWVQRLESAVCEGSAVDAPFSFMAVSNSPAAQLCCAQTWVADKCRAVAGPAGDESRLRHDRIRIAYLSADFGEHPVAHSIVELFELHDRSEFEVYGISFGPDVQSPTHQRVQRGVDRFIDVRGHSDREVVQLLRELEVDIAVDLNGYTQGHRSLIFAQRAAPVQVNYLGYSGSTGAGYMDYIIADARVILPGQEAFYSERVVRLPDSYLVNDRKRAVAGATPLRVEAGLPEEGFVFCCFNNSFKITPEVFDLWMRLLKRVGGSVLWLFEDNATAAHNLRREAEARGVDAQRLVFARRTPQLADHLARYRLPDLFLDTLPYNAHVTTVDALWTGLPVLTCMGSTFAGRVAGSLLHAAGLPELVTRNAADYEALAYGLANDPGRLASLRARLEANRATHALFDTDRYRRHIEAAYRRMHERSVQGLAPTHISIDPPA